MYQCPRRKDNLFFDTNPDQQDTWRADGTCSFCGGIPGDLFLRAAGNGAVITPTDKNYKAYVDLDGRGQVSFYFQHLTEEQQLQFIELHNAKALSFAYPGYLYVTPYFCKPQPRGPHDF